MPIANVQDAQEVERSLQSILAAPDTNARIQAIRTLFVEILDYDYTDQRVSLGATGNDQLPDEAYIVARRDGVSAVYVPLDGADSNRVTGVVASAAAKAMGNALADEPLLLFTNKDGDQLHIISSDLAGSRPRLQRIVAHRNQRQRTVVERIANMWDNYGNQGKTIREAIADAFSVEPVTKQFFETYREIFEEAEARISGFGNGKAGQEDKHLFTQTLFNRLMFVYFLSRKGWLKFNGDTDYLNALWHDHQLLPSHGSFYTARLRPLFFSGLNNPEPMDSTKELTTRIGEVPFLNGGLFEETDLDRREGITVPDETIKQILSGLFDRFNFTVMESTPFDVEVAVDPEMLGKVFEELVTGRNDSGAYYTPRTVVSFMCREALKGYLENQSTGLDTEAIGKFVDHYDTSDINVNAARRISEALSDVKVVDPACGSGAYLLGMMQELIELQTALYNAGADAKALYELKLEIIQRNLYGVDIDEFAVNVAMLRMWLSLAIDYEGEKPEPLPNLDLKVICGDSLLGPDPSAGVEVQGTLGQDAGQMQQLGQLKADYMRASLGPDKERLKKDIEDAEREVRDSLGGTGVAEGTVDWRVEFVEVFAANRGFDIAIANPPYVQLQKDSGHLGRIYKDCGYTTFTRTGDIYQLFYERGCQMLKPSRGLLAYITSNSWLKAEYGKSTRRYLSEKQTPLLLLELGKDVFEAAIVDSGVLMLREGGRSQTFPAVDMDKVNAIDIPPEPSVWGQVRPDGDAPWSTLSHAEQRVMDKMQAKGTLLREWDLRINRGILTGYNKAFLIDNKIKEELVAQDTRSAKIIKPILRGRDIRRYRAEWAGLWLVNVPWHFPLHLDPSVKGSSSKAEALFKKQHPAVYQHLLAHKDALSARNKSETGIRYEWYALQRWGANYHEEFAKEKLFWMDMSNRGRFAYSDTEMYCNNKGFMMTGESLKYLCAVLNSTLVTWLMKNTARTTGMGLTQWEKFVVERIPIPKITAEEQRRFVQLADEILKAKASDPDADTSHLEWEIDRLVYDLYGLTEEENTAIERSLGLIHSSEEDEDAALARAMDEALDDERVSRDEVMALLQSTDGD